jgi:amidohydrolase
MADWRAEIDAAIDAMADDLRETRRYLHANPEPSGEEYRTAELLAGRLGEAGIPRRLIPSGRGVIAGPESDAHGPTIAFRADIDALRIHDLKDVPYKSSRDGMMHACGHDAHATMALGAALALWRCREHLPGPVGWRAIFQPAEETGEGAREMVAAGAAEGLGAVVALHVDPDLPVGKVAHRTGVLTATCQDLSVTVRGAGGHAARPHQAVDPIAVAVQLVAATYQLIPRAVDAREAAVVTFGMIHGGTSPNVIPETVELQGTVRTLSRSAADRVEQRLRQVARGLAEASGATVEVRLERGIDAVVNDPAVTGVCVRAAAEVVGDDHVVPIPMPSMGAEDFAGYLAHAPGCLLRLGVAGEGRPRYFLHSPHFDIDERALAVGAKILARGVVLLAGRGPRS